MAKYSHTRDGIDDLMDALARVHRNEGIVAARAMLPTAIVPVVERLMDIENVGFTRAAETALRTAMLVGEMS